MSLNLLLWLSLVSVVFSFRTNLNIPLERRVPFKFISESKEYVRSSSSKSINLEGLRCAAKSYTDNNSKNINIFQQVADTAKIVWDFSRPHTIVGSGLSIICLFLFATPTHLWRTKQFVQNLLNSLIPSLLMNLYITGLNQVSDVEIDQINKPYLPIASGVLSKSNAIIIVCLSLIGALFNVGRMDWPLQAAIVGSGILGTAYSLPPFRLKRFPLLAALCILVVRGSLVNLGFFLQAKMHVINTAGKSLNVFSWSALKELLHLYPESVFVTAFFAVFGLVIAIMKDVPDVKGDTQYAIPSFSVTVGAKKMFRVGWTLLVSLLSATSVFSVVHASRLASSTLTQVTRYIAAAMLGIFAIDLRKRALKVEAEDPDKVFSYYMHMWNIFYLCYALLPFL